MSKKNNKNNLSRREVLMMAMVSGGGIGLRSLLTGLPIHFLTRRSIAQTSPANYLVYCARRSGDPMNCNVPGTYKEGYDHAAAFATPEMMTIGNQTHQAASAWNRLNNSIKQTANFFHMRTNTNSHNELDTVMKIFGSIEPIEGRSSEMLPSIISYEMSKRLNTQLQSPIAMGGILSFKGRNQQVYSPNSIRSLFPSNLSDSLINARAFRDQQIDLIYRDLASNGTPAQKRFLDAHAASGNQARQLGTQLSEALQEVRGNSQDDEMRTAAALLALNVTPAVTVDLNFGGDNHGDANLNDEVTRHNSGVDSINLLHDELRKYGIDDKTTFAMLNVFGRTTRRNSRGGRDHWNSQSVMFSFGPNIQGGMIGDTAIDNRGRYASQAINSNTGRVENPDIETNRTLHSAAKSLMVATGFDESKVNELVDGGKVVKAYLKS